MALDHQKCGVAGCTLHVGQTRTTSIGYRNEQIKEDWRTGLWSLEDLSWFWGLKRPTVSKVVQQSD